VSLFRLWAAAPPPVAPPPVASPPECVELVEFVSLIGRSLRLPYGAPNVNSCFCGPVMLCDYLAALRVMLTIGGPVGGSRACHARYAIVT
jgi:hypothetical protein